MHHKEYFRFLGQTIVKKIRSQSRQKLFIAVSLIAFATLGRLIPHPWNMTPVAAAALFAGVKLGKRYAVLVPLTAMLLSDAVVGFYDWHILLTVYVSMAAIGLYAYKSRSGVGAVQFFSRPLLASVVFFLTTNAAVCFFGDMYPHTLLGLTSSYLAGLPFFGRDLMGNLLYTSLFFAAYEFAVRVSHTASPRTVANHGVTESFNG